MIDDKASHSSLRETQCWFHESLVEPAGPGGNEVDAYLVGSDNLSARARLGIYQQSYHARLLRCLQQQFSALNFALGSDLFAEFALQYLAERPPQSYTLNALGDGFAEYLEAQRPDRSRADALRETWIDFMIDLARYEHRVHRLFDCAGHEDLPLADLSTPDDELVPQTTLELFVSDFPVAHYYDHVQRGLKPQLPPLERTFLVLRRVHYVVRTYPVSAIQFSLLREFIARRNITSAIRALAARTDGDENERFRAWQRDDGIRCEWIRAGFFGRQSERSTSSATGIGCQQRNKLDG